MAGVVKNLMVRAGADFSAITKQSKKAASSMKGMQQSVSKSCQAMSAAVGGLKKAFSALGVGLSLATLTSAAKAAGEAYDTQVEGEMRLARVMRNTMNASNDEIQSILDLTAAQQELGIIGDEVQLAGAQELATYLSLTDSLKTLIPVMNDMAAQQYGYNATAEETTNIATMLGKVMEGQVGGLSRYGYYFTEAQEAVLKYGTEAERAAMLAEVVEQSVGGMNAAVAATPTGRMQQLSNTLGDIKENFGKAVRTIGTAFMPLLNTMAKILADVATLANKVAQSIANVFGGKAAGKEWSYVPAGTAEAAEEAADSLDDLAKSTTNAGKAAEKSLSTADFDTLHILADKSKAASTAADSAAAGNAGTSGGSAAGTGIVETDTAVQEAGEGFGWLQKILEKVKAAWEKFKVLWDKFKSGLNLTPLKNAFNDLKTAFAPLTGEIGQGLSWLWEHVLVKLGTWTINELLPRVVEALAKAFELLHKVLVKLEPLLNFLWKYLIEPFAKIAGFAITSALDSLIRALDDLGDWMDGNTTPLQRFQDVLQTLAAIDLALIIGGLGELTAAAGAASAAVGGLGAAIGVSGMISSGGLISGLLGAGTAAGALGASFSGVAVPALGAGEAAAGAAAAGSAGLLGPIAAVVAIVAALGVAIYEAVKHWDEIKAAAQKAADSIKKSWSGFNDWFKTSVSQPLSDWGKKAWTSFSDSCKETAVAVKASWTEATENLRRDMENIGQAGKTAWESIKQFGTQAWSGIRSAWGQASSFFSSSVAEPIKNKFKAVVNSILSFFEGLGNGAISAANSIIGALNKISFTIPAWVPLIGGNHLGFSIPSITASVQLPRLAAGAVIPPNREFAAILGDQTRGMNIEAPEELLRDIVREESGNGAMLALLREILQAVQEDKYFMVDGYKLGKTVKRSMQQQARAAGYAGV